MTLRVGLLLLCCPLVGCATARVVRLDTGEGPPIIYTPARKVPPVEIDQREFEKALATLLLEMKFSLSDEGQPHLRLASTVEEPGGRYHRWCLQQSSPDECLSLLQGDLSLADASVRRQLALSFAWDGVWDGVAAEVRGIVNPDTLKLTISTALAAYMGLLILPEPVTKVVAVSLTTILIAYVGWNAFFDILDGWRELSVRSERAQSFGEIENAGHRFGDVMGRDGARVIIMALTAALGGGAAKLASKAPTLPAFARAVEAARTNAGFELSPAMAGGARTVAVAEGGITIELAPNVVAAVAAGSSGGAVGCGAVGPGAAEVGASRLVGANRAIIDSRKLTDYALNPSHPVGGNKARVFERLGFTRSNADDLLQQLRTGVTENTPIPGKVDQFGARFTVDIPVVGPKGSGIVRTGWIYKPGSNTPELTTLFVK